MAAPWEKYAAGGAQAPAAAAPSGPWAKYSAPEEAAPEEPEEEVPGFLERAAEGAGSSSPAFAGAELGLMGLSGAVAQPIAGIKGAATMVGNALGLTDRQPGDVVRETQEAITYNPRGRIAKGGLEMVGRGVQAVGNAVAEPVLAAVGERSLTAENALRSGVPAAAEIGATLLGVRGAKGLRPGSLPGDLRRGPQPSPESIVGRMDSQQSMGAAAAAPDLARASPELRQAIVTEAQRNGGAINPEVLHRHIDADTLPVPVKLLEGQATQDARQISLEQNIRGRSPELGEAIVAQNRALNENVKAIREAAGPDVFSTNPTEHGDSLIRGYKAKAAIADADISAKYQALRDANGGAFPVDAKILLRNSERVLHKGLLFDHAPPSIMKTLQRLADADSMTFENYESLRTNLARVQRSATDGNERAAAKAIRQEMENLPLTPSAAKLKPLADEARTAAKNQFKALEDDPAYAAAVDESVSPDRFVNRFVINGDRDNLARMRRNLGDNPEATQTMSVAAIDHLRNAARLDPFYDGNFASVSYSRALQQLSPKLREIMAPSTAEHLEQLSRVAKNITSQPRGSFVNNSNTFTGAAADAAEGALNFTTLGVPTGKWVRQGIDKVTTGRKVKKALRPGAGLGALNKPAP